MAAERHDLPKEKGLRESIEDWFRTQMRPLVEEYLLAPDSATALFDQTYIRQMLELDREGKDQLRRHINLLVSFELWHRTFMRN
jgi:asparagine synthase (glutamine-hydrolysing)